MKLVAFVDAAARRRLSRALRWVLISQVVGLAIFPLVNARVLGRSPGGSTWTWALLCIGALAGSYVLRTRSAIELATGLNRALASERVRLFDRLRDSPLPVIERDHALRAAFGRDLVRMLSVVDLIVPLTYCACIVVTSLIYVSLLDGRLLPVWAGILVAAAAWSGPRLRRRRQAAGRHRAARGPLADGVRRLLDGFKQLRADDRAMADYLADLDAHVVGVRRSAAAMADAEQRAINGSSTLLLAGIGLLLFVIPHEMRVAPTDIHELIVVLLVTFGPGMFLIEAVPQLLAAEEAADDLHALDARLGGEPAGGAGSPDFDTLTLDGLRFAYPTDDGSPGFTVGPIDLTLRRGQRLMITGGNGCGKTTLMKLVAGLYRPSGGAIRLDGRPLTEQRLADYRALFTVVTVHQHLFDRLYGVDADPARVEALLERFALRGVVGYRDGRFTTLDLSAGQRMRLALIVALLEDRPILVLDEWAAHQSPGQRRTFYEELLPELTAAGRTILLVSHDARYFHLSDHRIHMDRGRVVERPPEETHG